MDIHPLPEGGDHCGIVCQRRQHPQLDLGIVGVHQQVALLRLEEVPHPAARLGADGDILHIRLGAADAAGTGIGLAEHRTDAAVGADGVLEALHIGGGKLFIFAVLQYFADDGVIGDQLLQHLGIGGIAAFGLFLCGELQLAEQHVAQLLGGIDVELPAGKGVDLLLQCGGQPVQIDPEFRKALAVDPKAGQLHRGQHLTKGLLHFPQQLLLTVGLQLPFQYGGKQHEPQTFPCKGHQRLRRLCRRQGKPVLRQLTFHGVAARIGIEQVARQSRIHPQGGKVAPRLQCSLIAGLGVGDDLGIGQRKNPLPQVGGGVGAASQRFPAQQAQCGGGAVLIPRNGKVQGGILPPCGAVGLAGQRGKGDGRRLQPGGGRLRHGSRGGQAQSGDEPVELQPGKEGIKCLLLPGGGGQLAPRRHRHLAADGSQLPADGGAFSALGQLFA